MSFQQRLAEKRKLKLLQHTNSKLMPVEADDDWADGSRILSKYDNDAQIELERRKKSRIKIGETQAEKEQDSNRPTSSLETKKTMASDYFTEQEIGLKFKKPSLIGEKRNKHEPVEDIVAQLERSAVGENFLSTKRARQDAIESEKF